MGTIVVSGANGFLGSNLVKEFAENGYKVWIILRPESQKVNSLLCGFRNVHTLQCAYTDVEKMKQEIGSIDAWFHFAWGGVNREEIDSPEVQKANVEMSLAVLETSHALGCKIFMDAGSRVEYGITEDGKMDEALTCNPINEYGKAKLEFYQKAAPLCEKYKIKYCHLRFFSVYGYGDHPWSIISTLLRELPQGKKVSLSACKHKWNFMYIDDAVEAIYQLYVAIEKNINFKTGIFNIASSDTRELRSFVEEIHNMVGQCGELEFGTFVQAKEGALSIIPSTLCLQDITGGWKERYTFEEGIQITLEKMRRANEKN